MEGGVGAAGHDTRSGGSVLEESHEIGTSCDSNLLAVLVRTEVPHSVVGELCGKFVDRWALMAPQEQQENIHKSRDSTSWSPAFADRDIGGQDPIRFGPPGLVDLPSTINNRDDALNVI